MSKRYRMSFIVKIKLQLIVNWYKTEIIGWRKPSFLRDSLRECLRYNNNILEELLIKYRLFMIS